MTVSAADQARPVGRIRTCFRAITALILREIATTYGAAPGGYLWAVLEPIAGIALLTIVFSLGFQAPALGTSFAMFYATGVIPFLMFTDIAGKVAYALLFSRPLLVYPRISYVDAILARFLLAAGTQALIGSVVLVGIAVMFDTRVVPDFSVLLLAMALTQGMALGVGTLNAFLFAAVPVWARLWSIAMKPMFIISGVFFTFESVPEPFRSLLWYNPLTHLIGLLRKGLYPTYEAGFASVPYIGGIALSTFVLGMLYLKGRHRDILNG